MKEDPIQDRGISLLIRGYKKRFRIPENLNHYAREDYKVAEKKFVKYALAERFA